MNSASFCESESAGQILRRYLTSTSRCFHNLGTDVLSSWVQGCDTHVLKNATRHGAGYMLQSSLLEFKRLCGPSSGHPQGGLGPRFRPITCITSSQSQEGAGESRRSRSSIPALQNLAKCSISGFLKSCASVAVIKTSKHCTRPSIQINLTCSRQQLSEKTAHLISAS